MKKVAEQLMECPIEGFLSFWLQREMKETSATQGTWTENHYFSIFQFT